jgi:hypothetical protein
MGVEIRFHTFITLTLDEGVYTVPVLSYPSPEQTPDQEFGWAPEVSLNTVHSSCPIKGLNPGLQLIV